MFDVTSVIMMSIFEIIWLAKVISLVWRIFFDNQLSVVLTKLEETHDKLIHLNVVRPMKIKMKWFVIPGIIVHLISSCIILIRLLVQKCLFKKTQNNILFLVTQMVTNICECVAFYEYILLILYIQWMVFIINEQTLLRYSTISTSRDMYLEALECLNDINRSIYGLPAIMGFISANFGDTIFVLYSRIFTPMAQALRDVFVLCNIITLSTKLFNVILLYAIGCATEKENYTVHIFGLIMFTGIVSSSPIGQMYITQKTVVSLLFFEWQNSREDVNLTTILKTSILKDENNYQDCVCTPFHKCNTYKLNPDGKAIIDIRTNVSPCPSYLDVCCSDTKITQTQMYQPSTTVTTDRDCSYDFTGSYSKVPNIDHKDSTKKPSDGQNDEYTKKQSDHNKGDHTKDPYVTHNEDDTEKPSDSHKQNHTQQIYVTNNEEDTEKLSDVHKRNHTQHIYVTNNEDDTEKQSVGHKRNLTQQIYVTNNEDDTEKPSDGHKQNHTQQIYVTNNEEDNEETFNGHKVDHFKEPYVTHNEEDTKKTSDSHKVDHTKDPYVTNNEDDTEKPSDGHKRNLTQQIYVTNNEDDTEKPSDGHKQNHTQQIYVTNNEEDNEETFNGHKVDHSNEPYVTHNEEDTKKTSDSHKVDHTKDPYVTNNEDDTEKPSDGHKQNHTQQIYVTNNEEDNEETFNGHKVDHSKEPYVTHNEEDTKKTSDSHKVDHTKDPYVTNNEDDTEKPSDGHKRNLTQQIYVTNNEDDTEKPSDGHKQNHTQQIYVTNNEEDNEETFNGHKVDHSKEPYVTHNEEDTKKTSDSHKVDHTKDPYVTNNEDDTEKPSDGHKQNHTQLIYVTNNEEDNEETFNGHKVDHSKEPYVTHNEKDTEKISNGHKVDHTKDPYVTNNDEVLKEKSIADEFISTTEPDKSLDDHQAYHKCGVWNQYGVGFSIRNAIDSETQFGEFPSMVAIFKEKVTKNGEKVLVKWCVGSLIRKYVILTVAHCVFRANISELVVRAGEWDLKTEKEILNHQDRKVTKVTHPHPYSGGFYNNVALIFTEHSFDLQDNIQLMCLPSQNDIIINKTCYSSGWGKTIAYNNYTIVKESESGKMYETGQYKVSILKKYELPMVPRDDCSLDLLGPKDLLQDSYICAGGMNGQDMCRDDGGSPFMCPYKDEPDRLVQVGIVVQCGKKNKPGAYMNVISFMEWINNEIEKYSGY